MSRLSINELSELTGFSRTKIRKDCATLHAIPGDKGAKLYNAREALPLLYGREEVEGQDARLTRARAEKAEIEVEQLKGNYLLRSVVVEEVQKMFGNVRSKLLSLPTKAAPEVAILAAPKEVLAYLENMVHESLRELSEGELADRVSGRSGAATPENGKRVGRPRKTAQQRG